VEATGSPCSAASAAAHSNTRSASGALAFVWTYGVGTLP